MKKFKRIIYFSFILFHFTIFTKIKHLQYVNHLAVIGSLKNAGHTFLDGNVSVQGDHYVKGDHIVDGVLTVPTVISSELTGNLTGAASLNLLKSGDAMTGDFHLADEACLNLGDGGLKYRGSSNYIGLKAPTTIEESYILKFPGECPEANQILKINPNDFTQFDWYTIPGSLGKPDITRTIYVSKAGDDNQGDGSFNNPYITVTKAVEIANNLSTSANPITISVGGGIFVENNEGSPIAIMRSGISIVGESTHGTIISPSTLSNNLFNVIGVDIEFNSLTLDAVSTDSTASGVFFLSDKIGNLHFDSIALYRFSTAIELISTGSSKVLCNINECIISGVRKCSYCKK